MPRFYMHLRDNAGDALDEDGLDLPGVAEAQVAAIEAARDVMASDVRSGTFDTTLSIDVEDERGATIFNLAFSAALTVYRR